MSAHLARLHLWVIAQVSSLLEATDPASPAASRLHRNASGPMTSDRGDAGQATAEYALVLLGAALVALLLVAWASGGGGAGKIGQLLDRVVDSITSRV